MSRRNQRRRTDQQRRTDQPRQINFTINEEGIFIPTNENIRAAIEKYLSVGDSANLPPINQWDTSQITNMSGLFSNLNFNEDISIWNVSNVINMSKMFENAISFNQPLNNWNVSNVTNMSKMFENARNFNQPLNNWDVSIVTNMKSTFNGARNFNQSLDLWNVSNVRDMSNMFEDAVSFNQPLSNWDVSNVRDMSNMFNGATTFNQDLSMWQIRQNIEMYYMFENAQSMQEEFKPLTPGMRNIRNNVIQPQRQIIQPQRNFVDPHQVHKEFRKIDLEKLISILAPERITIEYPETTNFAKFIKNSLTDIIQSITDIEVKERITNGVNNILTQRINQLRFKDFTPLLIKAIYHSLNYVKTLPPEAQQEYIEAFVKDCVNAYEGSAGMTCAGGALERIIKSLEVACTSIISSNPENAKKCENIIAVLNNDINKLIQEAILDRYREHRQGSQGEFPSTMSIEDKKENLRQYLTSKFPTNEARDLIDSKISEFEMSIGFESDDFTYGGRKRRGTLKRKYKKLAKTKKNKKHTKKQNTIKRRKR